MNKKIWSIILLCIIVIYFVPMALMCIDMVGSAYEIATVGLVDAQLPGAAFVVGWAIFLSIIGISFLTTIGIGLSILCGAISYNSTVRTISIVFIFIYSMILILDFGSAIIALNYLN